MTWLFDRQPFARVAILSRRDCNAHVKAFAENSDRICLKKVQEIK